MELAETRDRLRKREDEVRDLKINLNDQIAHVDSEYRMQLQEYREQNQDLQNQLEELTKRVEDENRLRLQAQEERTDIADRYERQREAIKNSAKELIET